MRRDGAQFDSDQNRRRLGNQHYMHTVRPMSAQRYRLLDIGCS
jgi:hypothetical protein